ncbi:4-hydroxy-3-methylbut-2-enyl diphosphate reductase [Sulfobacillus thermosulfidooxidans]|uniref:4-hydroxy-3-methylbut-2-enyl diphosphate reductase n=2 Tax=Sulfobacillus thermosulfidooxidans TaxID=28034 RepID=A0A1W1WGD3_SULTA|nr:4-hydroxy-3-methylbut-2-enyl diphosphate reductase [Sulfobacillus thermosulfidooxidans]OLZ08705.1 4-hydroxy-3-methylbut-2-enyl diphosphate reductase [Sulfobacillus thermosulfidooxidans]OLZ17328.1 4-hydroxy-3-methylbut-2-enyl diphosphate reductase [Sulfobacillus thermosulfidooxidans]OLZ19355.1 4-hydroxy-3-methylbut-2-enyl diphosphate reductase [Sulfobacillus thermosulfidooxidans]PSR27245.1 MAG: 4-hydroxy-3-methylbut-2-enyl diphosphate reductase [Sulfobacillus thermosulfidooxidans]SMC05239.1 
MNVVKIHPRGYCYGVVDAITMAKRIAQDPKTPRPIYILGQIVHNQHTVLELEQYGITTLDGGSRLELLDKVPDGATVIFTAHGISPAVKARAQERHLTFFDATCPDVTKTHTLIQEKIQHGYSIIYIGTKGHPEPEGAMGEAPPDRVFLVTNVQDVDSVPFDPATPLAIVTQTTLSQWDTQAIIEALLARYPHAEVHNEICLATQLRQEAAVKAAKDVDMVVVVGDRRSNNSNRLVEVVEKIAHKPSVRVESVEDLDPNWFEGVKTVGVTAGSSTPSRITREVINRLETLKQPD